jgi:heme A synthase
LSAQDRRTFQRFAWLAVGYYLFVILWGALVRMTDSGAGCGASWPSCNAALWPDLAQSETVIEFVHRLTSMMAGFLGLALAWWSRKWFGKNDPVSRASFWALILLVTEALIGGFLVRYELVLDDDSVLRAVTSSLHLCNTLALMAFATRAAWFSGVETHKGDRGQSGSLPLLLLIGLIVLSCGSGAVTALGDTVFPELRHQGLSMDRVWDQLTSAEHFLVQLRVIHPFIAVFTIVFGLFVFGSIANKDSLSQSTRNHALMALGAMVIQGSAGYLNIVLNAPYWMQLVHLLLANLIWMLTLTLTWRLQSLRSEDGHGSSQTAGSAAA